MKKIVAVAIFLLSVAFCYGQSDKKFDGVAFWDSKIVKINYASFGGLSLNYQGKSYSIASGLRPDLINILKMDALAKPLVEGYQIKQTVSSILFWGGIGCVVGSLFIIASPASYTGPNSSDLTSVGFTGLWLAIGGELLQISSPFVAISSYEDITEGVNIYDRDQMKLLH